jgi:hypothetical protein
MDAAEINEAREQGIYSREARVLAVAANGPHLSVPGSGSLDGASFQTQRALNRPDLSGGSTVWETGAYGKDDEPEAVSPGTTRACRSDGARA